MKTYVFPGQGSQVPGMGRDLFREFPDLTGKANEILGYSIEKLCLENPEGKLNLTQYTQPALFVVNALAYLKRVKETKETIDFTAGHSLGEYNAIFAAGGFDFETGLQIVKKRGELMSQANGGAMAAIIGVKSGEVEAIIKRNKLDKIDIANLNTPIQTVISATPEALEEAAAIFREEKCTFVKLNVSAAFHSRYMKPAQEEFKEFLSKFTFQKFRIPVISNYTALPYGEETADSNLVSQLASPVRWVESVQFMLGQGVTDFEEITTKPVLTKMIKTIRKEYEEQEARIEKQKKAFALKENITEFRSGNHAARQLADEFNQKYPVGTLVTCKQYGEQLKTKTEAKVLFGHRAAIYLENYNGYFALEDVVPVCQKEPEGGTDTTYTMYQLLDESPTKTNVYVIADNRTKKAAIIDPACELEKIKELVERKGLRLEKVLLTHAHSDHIRRVQDMIKIYGTSIYIAEEEVNYFHCEWKKMKVIKDGDTISIGDTKIKVLLTPGHSPGSVCYVMSDSIFTGDTVFIEGCGICFGGDKSIDQMYESIQKLKNETSDNLKVYPGHTYQLPIGETMKSIKQFNIYFNIHDKEKFSEIQKQMNKNNMFVLS